MRFTVFLRRLIPFVGYHHVLMILLAVSWVLLGLLLSGCTSSTTATTGIYILGLRYNDTVRSDDHTGNDTHDLALRVGYFGVCAQRGIETEWLCARGKSGIEAILLDSEADTQDITAIGVRFKDEVLFSGFLIGGLALTILAFILFSTFPGWREELDATTGSEIDIKPFPSRTVSQTAMVILFVAAMLLLISCLWQHVAAASAVSTLSAISQRTIVAHVGAAGAALAWVSFALVVVVFQGILVIILSIQLLFVYRLEVLVAFGSARGTMPQLLLDTADTSSSVSEGVPKSLKSPQVPARPL